MTTVVGKTENLVTRNAVCRGIMQTDMMRQIADESAVLASKDSDSAYDHLLGLHSDGSSDAAQ